MKRTITIAALAAACAWSGAARAQDFPPDEDWFPLECGGDPMTDGVEDEPGATLERDIVGDDADPAGLRAVDGDFAYFRLRLDADPVDQGDLLPFSWGFEFDLDGNTSTYEVLILVTGMDQMVSIFTNDTTTQPDDPTDPADQPPVDSDTFASFGRSAAASSNFNGDADRFLDIAIPWDQLEPLGFNILTEIHVWAASSSADDTLDADFACHDGADGDPNLSDIASDPTVIDPDDTDGDGFSDDDEIDAGSDPDDPDSTPDGTGPAGDPMLEGGGGCSTTGAPGAGLWLALLVLALLAATRSRGRASRRP